MVILMLNSSFSDCNLKTFAGINIFLLKLALKFILHIYQIHYAILKKNWSLTLFFEVSFSSIFSLKNEPLDFNSYNSQIDYFIIMFHGYKNYLKYNTQDLQYTQINFTE